MIRGIAVDNLVRRATGGPVMLVLSVTEPISGEAPMAICAWPENKHVASTAVPINQLEIVQTE
jgi:hypothetical protein